MDYINKLFGQYPFIYYINGKYYAFGTNVCTECNGKSLLLESKYKAFEESIKNDVTDEEAWIIFHKLSSEASDKKVILLHKPHPEDEMDAGAVKDLVGFLKELGEV